MKLMYLLLFTLLFPYSVYSYEELPVDARESVSTKGDTNKQESTNEGIDLNILNIPEKKLEGKLGINTIANLISDNIIGSQEVVLVDKAARRMYVAKISEDKMEVLKEFPVLTGRIEGNKIKQGDEKTPEGVYYVVSYTSGKDLVKKYGDYALIYGAGSFPINYPNIIDKIYRKTGGGIWLHGINDKEHKNYTRGCVALNNKHFLEMAEKIKISTPVIIAENLIYTNNNEDYNKIKEERLNLLNDFTKKWSENNKEAYSNFIHNKFRTNSGVKSKQYLRTKLSLMDRYPEKIIQNYNTKVFMHSEKYTVYDVNQFYCAANMSSYSNKKYYFVENKLISEEIYNLPLASTPGLNNFILNYVNSWVDAWTSQDIQNYMSYYHTRFKSGKDNYSSWKARKTRLFNNKNEISIKVSDVKWSVQNGVYTITFVQDYSAGNLSDKGVKTLKLSGCPTSFKILSETWRGI